MNDEQPGTERITLSRSAVRQLQREARARGYAQGRHDEHRDTARRLATSPVPAADFVHEAVARAGESFAVVWNVLQSARTETGGGPR